MQSVEQTGKFMGLYQYPDGGELDPRIETPQTPEPQPEPDTPPEAAQASGNPVREVICETVNELFHAQMAWTLGDGRRLVPHAGQLLVDAIEEIVDLARIYGIEEFDFNRRPLKPDPREVMVDLTMFVSQTATRPLPIAISTWFANLNLELLLCIAR